MHTEISFICQECNNPLSIECDTLKGAVIIPLCKACKEEATQEGFEEGENAGYEEGFNDGHQAGYDEGVGDCPNERLVMLQNSLQALRDLTQVQCTDGNWNCNPYMHGMANGMIFALSLFEAGEPKYLDAPAEWLKDRPTPEVVSEASAT